jgi:hypothetical protein
MNEIKFVWWIEGLVFFIHQNLYRFISRKTCPLYSTPVRLAVPCDWVVTRGLLRGRFWLYKMTCTWRELWCSSRSRSGIPRRHFSAAQFTSANYFSSGFIFFLWCGRLTSYVPCRQLYCSCICSCDWIERLRLICDFAIGWWLGCDYTTTSSCAQWRGHVISHCPVVQVAATCRIPVQRWIFDFLCVVWRV